MQKIPLTVRGAELLKQELQHLKSVATPRSHRSHRRSTFARRLV